MKKYIFLNLSALFALFLAGCMFISCGKSKKSKPSEEGQRQPKASPSANPLLSSRERKIAKSINNQKQIGQGYVMYLDDNEGWFPRVAGPASVGGKQGDGIGSKGKPLPALVARLYGAKVPANERPLNDFVGDIRIFMTRRTLAAVYVPCPVVGNLWAIAINLHLRMTCFE